VTDQPPAAGPDGPDPAHPAADPDEPQEGEQDRPASRRDTGYPEVDDPEAARTDALAAEPGGLRGVTEVHRPSTIGGIVYLAVLAAAVAGIVIAALGAWRTGVSWLGVALLVAATTRLLLREESAGMLQVRRRTLDAAILATMGIGLLVLAFTIPNQPG
jgi:hypothetical protein